MGKPGGFFKRLHSKQKRQANHQRRGTKGASKEERKRKREEQAIYYAAKREAEELAAVSASDEDDVDAQSTDSDDERKKETKKLHKLHSVLGVRSTTKPVKGATGVPIDPFSEEDEPKEDVTKSPKTANPHSAEQDETDNWKDFIGDEEEESEEKEEEDEDALMMDIEDEEDEPGVEVDNPLLCLENDAMDDVFEPVVDFNEEAEEEEEAEDESEDDTDREADYVDEENNSPRSGKGKREEITSSSISALLPAFQWGSSGGDALEKSGVVRQDDPWYQKYHLNRAAPVGASQKKKEKHSSPPSSKGEKFSTIPISPSALEALSHTNEPLMEKAEKEVARMLAEKQQRLPSFVRKEDYAILNPANVALDADEMGESSLLHSPFDVSSNGPSQLTSKPSYMHDELWKRWKAYREKQELPVFTVEERGLFDLCQGYADLFDTAGEWQSTASRREIYVLHALNHWFKARSVMAVHDAILMEKKKSLREKKNDSSDGTSAPEPGNKRSRDTSKKEYSKAKSRSEVSKASLNDSESDEDEEDELENYEYRDRGFGKTRLLIMLPIRHHAYLYVHTMVEILGVDPNECDKLHVFQQDFTEIEEALDPTFRRRPRDYQREFEGNIDDTFCVGIKLDLQKIGIYAHPLNSDIILCSPLGLRRRIEKNGDAFISLSSIEVCIVDYAHMLALQNWVHVSAVFDELLNQRPLDTTCGLSDLRRTYSWALENKSVTHRQTIISSELCLASILNTFRSMKNSWGKLRLYIKLEEGVLMQVKAPIPQHFIRFTPQSLLTNDEERLEHFTQHIFATRLNPLAERDVRIIIFVPSYFDFVRLRAYLHREHRDTCAAISEYSSIKQQRKALGQFSDLERPVLLVTERFYYFKRYFVSMSEVVVFYSPPLVPKFYLSFVNRLTAESPNAFALTLFSRYDIHELVRIVGTAKAQQLLQRESSIFSFMTS